MDTTAATRNPDSASLEKMSPTGVHIEHGKTNSHEPSTHSSSNPEDIDEEEEFRKREAAVVFKLDCFIAPVMMLLMLISYLDRGNVSSSKTPLYTCDKGENGTKMQLQYSHGIIYCLSPILWVNFWLTCEFHTIDRSVSLQRRDWRRILD
jgi:hypothetical protein